MRLCSVRCKLCILGVGVQQKDSNIVSSDCFSIEFEEGEIETGDCIYSYHTDALINEVIEDLAEEKNISDDYAKNYLYLSGSTIYSTQDSNMQEKVEEESLKSQYILYSENGEDTSQAAMVILNHQTGEVLACTGGLRRKRDF